MFGLPHNLFHSLLLYKIFSHPSQYVFKMGYFHYIKLENCMWKYGEVFFFFFWLNLMWIPNIEVIKLTMLMEMIFRAWFWYFEYVLYLRPDIMLIVLNEYLNLITVNFIWPTWSWSIIQREISSMKLWPFWHDQSVTEPSPYTLQVFFALHLCFYLSSNNKV